MKKISTTILVDGIEYDVIIEKKNIKNVYFRFHNGKFYASCPIFYLKSFVIKNLHIYAKKLIKEPRVDLQNHTIQIFGVKIYSEKNIFNVLGYSLQVNSSEDFYKQIKPILFKYISERVLKLSIEMGVELQYKVKIKEMKSRLGSNSKATNTLNFTSKLIHFSKDAIDSVIIHELAHYFYFDHSKNFYDVVYKYCPNYDKLNKEFKQ